RITDTSETLIDVILTTKPETITDVKVIASSLSDHDIIGFKRKTKNKKNKQETLIRCRDYSKYNPEDLRNDLRETNFDAVFSDSNPNTAWNNFQSILRTTFDRHAPFISKKVKTEKSAWLNRELKQQMNQRDALQRKFRKSRSTEDFENYKRLRNRVNINIRKAKNEHSQRLLRESANDPNRFWKAVKKIYPTKVKETISKAMLIGERLTTNAKEIASSFCSFFSKVATTLKSKAAPLKDIVWSKPEPIFPNTYSTFHFREVQVSEVFKHLKKLSRNKASGPDELPPGMLKDCAAQICNSLCHVINASIKTGFVPECFKFGNVTPIHKSGSKQVFDNYRPITVLPVCSKIFEKCIHQQISQFLEERRLLSPTQFGFRKERNTELAATLLLDEIRRATDKGNVTGAIFVDLSKAFDTLSHSQIIESLKSYGITGKANDLFTNYLFGRKQSVCFGAEISKPEPVTCGVPQGSILGPLLFLITFNDVSSVIKYSNIITYADDTVIYVSGKNKDEVQTKLQKDFLSVTKWLDSKDLVINMKKGKTECMLFGTAQKIKNKTLEVTNNHQHRVHIAKSYKYLGVLLDQTLSLREHIDKTYKKAAGRLYLLRRIRPQLTTKVAMTIFKTMLMPLFTYCSIITSNYTNTIEARISNFEKRAIQVIYGEIKNDPKLSIRACQRKRMSMQVLECLNGNVCDNFKNYFELLNNKTRNRGKLLRLPHVKLESTKKSFYFNGAKNFNNLPVDLRSTSNISQFGALYDKIFRT
ncbi:MAG: reverse transcriptase family protein, partial [Pseudomonadota bacterium]